MAPTKKHDTRGVFYMHASKIRNGNGNGSPHRKQQQIKQIRFRIFIIKIRVFYEYWESEWESFRTPLNALLVLDS